MQRILHINAQSLHALGVRIGIGCGEAVHRNAAADHLVVFIHKVRDKAAVGHLNLTGAVAVIPLADSRPFEAESIEAIARVSLAVANRAAVGHGALECERGAVSRGKQSAIVQMFKMAEGAYLHPIGGIFRIQTKKTPFFIYRHYCTSVA